MFFFHWRNFTDNVCMEMSLCCKNSKPTVEIYTKQGLTHDQTPISSNFAKGFVNVQSWRRPDLWLAFSQGSRSRNWSKVAPAPTFSTIHDYWDPLDFEPKLESSPVIGEPLSFTQLQIVLCAPVSTSPLCMWFCDAFSAEMRIARLWSNVLREVWWRAVRD